jgi:hypothetical protein
LGATRSNSQLSVENPPLNLFHGLKRKRVRWLGWTVENHPFDSVWMRYGVIADEKPAPRLTEQRHFIKLEKDSNGFQILDVF